MNLTIDERRRAGSCVAVHGRDATGTHSERMQFYARRGTAFSVENPKILSATCRSVVKKDPVDRSAFFTDGEPAR